MKGVGVALILVGFAHAYALKDPRLAPKFPDYKDHPCVRDCKENDFRICYYNFTIEWMLTNEPNCDKCLNGTYADCFNSECMLADGSRRLINPYNRLFPGPAIEVCQDDTVVVDIRNGLLDASTSIHWHGLHQRNTPFMDGVPMITQCPITPYTTFRYKFKASEAGTHFYHSHSATQRANGAYGHLIVRQPARYNNLYNLYDYDLPEHVISVSDWFKDFPLAILYKILRTRVFDWQQITTLVVNGFGPAAFNNVPPKVFYVQQGATYRFRIIHAGSTVCPIEIKIAKHKVLVIATDGSDIDPVEADSLFITNGERYDVIVKANQKPDSYVITFEGTNVCNRSSYAVLQYKGAPLKKFKFADATKTLPKAGTKVNCPFTPDSVRNCINYDKLTSYTPADYSISRRPDFNYDIAFDVIEYAKPMEVGLYDEETTTPHINNITMEYPSKPLLQNDKDNKYCNKEHRQVCDKTKQICECVHLVDVPFGAMVEFIYVDEGLLVDLLHPMHMHGYRFYVVATDKLGSNTTLQKVKDLDRKGKISRNLYNPPLKDTLPVPDGGYVIVRFIADNVGFWFMHCHVDFHMEEGMAMVFSTGGEAPMIPKDFPQCGDYTPPPSFIY